MLGIVQLHVQGVWSEEISGTTTPLTRAGTADPLGGWEGNLS
jgi:hypothetical protein